MIKGLSCIFPDLQCLWDDEIKHCIDAKTPLPSKIYLQVDGASDNTAYCVNAAIEHLVWCWTMSYNRTLAATGGSYSRSKIFV